MGKANKQNNNENKTALGSSLPHGLPDPSANSSAQLGETTFLKLFLPSTPTFPSIPSSPGSVCCGVGIIFVTNQAGEASGDPLAAPERGREGCPGSSAAAEMRTRPCSGQNNNKKKLKKFKFKKKKKSSPVAKGGEARGGIPGISVGNPPAPATPWRHSARPSERLPVGSRRLGWGTPAGTRSCPTGTGCSRPQLAEILHFGLWM